MAKDSEDRTARGTSQASVSTAFAISKNQNKAAPRRFQSSVEPEHSQKGRAEMTGLILYSGSIAQVVLEQCCEI
jgi:hypothetical protein